ncbi:hypothetical protein Terro_4306 [Terriglobus roseus DSM 18391]|uniref:DUF885 domain-containing protein n=2 Tax=Terriglobus roseus TaxID=392734 RepID=I3ZMN5_TERRK|nr:hypothetical protein Terro_4306 [Terriglobus roseus DSM 18391]
MCFIEVPFLIYGLVCAKDFLSECIAASLWRMRLLPALLLCCTAVPAFAQVAPVADRVAQQNTLFEEYFQANLKRNPTSATSLGDFRYNALLAEVSLDAIAKEHADNDAYLARLKAIPTTGMEDTDLTSHQLLVRRLEQSDVSYSLKNYEMPVNQQSGIHTSLADLALSVPFDTVPHYEDYIARLHAIPRVLTQTMGVMRQGQKDGLMPPKLITEKLAGQCDGIIAADPFLLPLKKFPASFSDADKAKLTEAMTAAVNTDVLPAYKQFASFLRTEYAPKGRTELSIESLPDGKRRYAEAVKQMTTLEVTPAQVHAIGLSEVARITADMTVLAKKAGYKDLASWRAAINADPKWKPTSEQQIVDDFAKYIHQMEPKLPQLFNLLPKSPVTVEAIPDFAAAEATHYNAGSPDGKRPGRVVVAVANPTTRTLVLDEAVAYHEGVPGHHNQISVAQTLKGLPKFRLRGGYTAYTEGWALYAEELGKEVGFYQDPISDYGRLNSELFRAVRLVVDTGIHDLGWSRDKVIAYMHENDVNDAVAQTETDRYIAWPGQALAYKMGQLEIRKLRDKAKAKLGAKYDIKAFHDEVLDGGALPLDVLDARVSKWIDAQAAVK